MQKVIEPPKVQVYNTSSSSSTTMSVVFRCSWCSWSEFWTLAAKSWTAPLVCVCVECCFGCETLFYPDDSGTLLKEIRAIMDECGFGNAPLKPVENGRFFLGDQIGTLTIAKLREVRSSISVGLHS